MFDWVFFILAGNKDTYKISDGFEIRPDSTRDFLALESLEKIPIYITREKCCDHSSAFNFEWIFFFLADKKDNHKNFNEFEL